MRLSFRFAARELRAGTKGFRIFLACLALGVAAIAAAGSTAEAFRRGLASEASEILGGDLAISLEQRRFTAAERAAIAQTGRSATAVGARAMAESASGERRLVEFRGVSGAYPLSGRVELAGAATLAQAFAPDGDAAGVAVEQRCDVDDREVALAGHARASLSRQPARLKRVRGLV